MAVAVAVIVAAEAVAVAMTVVVVMATEAGFLPLTGTAGFSGRTTRHSEQREEAPRLSAAGRTGGIRGAGSTLELLEGGRAGITPELVNGHGNSLHRRFWPDLRIFGPLAHRVVLSATNLCN